MDSIPFNLQLQSLVSYVKYEKLYNKISGNVDSCYKTMNMDCLLKTDNIFHIGGTVSKILIDNRNLRWITPLVQNIENKSVIIAVGLGHLFGKNGLINLLREQGYEVTPVKLN